MHVSHMRRWTCTFPLRKMLNRLRAIGTRYPESLAATQSNRRAVRHGAIILTRPVHAGQHDVLRNCPIGEPDSPVRKRSDQVLKYVIRPAAEACKLTALRADEISKPGLITTQVIQHILEDPIVVADLTGHNANVFYELAIRHAIRRPYVQIIDDKDRLPFDVAGIRSIQFSHIDLDSVSFAREEIAKQITLMLESNDPCESPITVAVDLSTLSKSTNPEDRRIGDVLTAISELTRQVASLQHQFNYGTANLINAASYRSANAIVADPGLSVSMPLFVSAMNTEPLVVRTSAEPLVVRTTTETTIPKPNLPLDK